MKSSAIERCTRIRLPARHCWPFVSGERMPSNAAVQRPGRGRRSLEHDVAGLAAQLHGAGHQALSGRRHDRPAGSRCRRVKETRWTSGWSTRAWPVTGPRPFTRFDHPRREPGPRAGSRRTGRAPRTSAPTGFRTQRCCRKAIAAATFMLASAENRGAFHGRDQRGDADPARGLSIGLVAPGFCGQGAGRSGCR